MQEESCFRIKNDYLPFFQDNVELEIDLQWKDCLHC